MEGLGMGIIPRYIDSGACCQVHCTNVHCAIDKRSSDREVADGNKVMDRKRRLSWSTIH